jgi:hypothetical protein
MESRHLRAAVVVLTALSACSLDAHACLPSEPMSGKPRRKHADEGFGIAHAERAHPASRLLQLGFAFRSSEELASAIADDHRMQLHVQGLELSPATLA